MYLAATDGQAIVFASHVPGGILKRIVFASIAFAGMGSGCEGLPEPDHYAGAMMPLVVSADPVQASSGYVIAGDVVGRHRVNTLAGVTLKISAQGITRIVPAGTPLAQGLVGKDGISSKVDCDFRQTDAFVSTRGDVDCFEEADNDGQFETIWTGRPAISTFTLSLQSAGFHGSISPVGYERMASPPSTEVGFMTFICWNGEPAFVLAILKVNGNCNYSSGPCAAGDHPGEVSKDGKFRGMGAGIKVTGDGDVRLFGVMERISPGPISLGAHA